MKFSKLLVLTGFMSGTVPAGSAEGVVRISDHLKDRKIYRDSLCLVVSHQKVDNRDPLNSPTRTQDPVACRFHMKASLNLHKKYKDVKNAAKREILIRAGKSKKYPYPGAEKSFVLPWQEARLVCFDFSRDFKELPRHARIRDYYELDTACVKADKAGVALEGFREDKTGVFAWNLKGGLPG